jgi:hypothetical protein
MSHYDSPERGQPFNNPAPMPKQVPHVDEIGATSAPLKSASFFIGTKCQEFNGMCGIYLCCFSSSLKRLVPIWRLGLNIVVLFHASLYES